MDLPRQIALDILIAWDREGSYPNLLLKNKLDQLTARQDRAFCTNLVYGTVENKRKLDFMIASVSSVPLKKIHVVTRNILRLGLYQGAFLNVPVSAACNTSVDLAKKNGQFKSRGFVNAILRKLLSLEQPISLPLGDSYDEIAVRYSVDSSIVKLLCEEHSVAFALEYLEHISKLDTSESYLAVNTLKTDAVTLREILADEGIKAEVIDDGLLRASVVTNPVSLSAFQNGLFHVMGLPSYKTACALNVHPDEIVLDLCSAPGGKTFAMAYKMQNRGKIIAMDIHPHKIDLMQKQAQRLGITNIEFLCSDATILKESLINFADKVLCDVPCSGIGIIRKKPDIRYKDLSNFNLYPTQLKILENGCQYLKNEGLLVYSTCTVNPLENRGIVDRACCRFIEDRLFLPQNDKTEGFYFAKVKKEVL